MKLTATVKETEDYESLCPNEDITFGKKCVPRYMEASMFDLLQSSNQGPTSQAHDYKANSLFIKDRVNKSSKSRSYDFL